METRRSHEYDEQEEDEDLTEISTTPFFFADATLDLDTAHDIAETPDARHDPTTLRKHIGIPTGARTTATPATTPNHHPVHRPSVPLQAPAGTPAFLGFASTTTATTTTTTTTTTGNTTKTGNTTTTAQATATATALEMEGAESSGKSEFHRIGSPLWNTSLIPPPRHRPKWPRDVWWAISFLVVVPAGLIWPICMEEEQEHHRSSTLTTSPLVRAPLSTATLHALGWASVVTFFASRYFYRTAPGPDGEDARYHIGQVLQAATALSVAVYATLGVVVWLWLPLCPWWTALIPAWFTISHILLLRQWRRRGDRQAFFQALASMALDILTKSLRRSSFFRVLSMFLLFQTLLLFFWRWALLGALGSHSWIVFLWALAAGKWATGTVARFLSFLASGGVYTWFVQQSAAVAALPHTPRIRDIQSDQEDADDYYDHNNHPHSTTHPSHNMPEAYRTADGSVYQSVLDVEDILSDDGDDRNNDENEDFWETPARRRPPNATSSSSSEHKYKSTVMSLLLAGLTVSFGSIVQCGLLGGLAQFVWSQLRKLQAAQSVWARLREAQRGNGNNNNTFLATMPIGIGGNTNTGHGTTTTTTTTATPEERMIQNLWIQCLSASRKFVRNHSDLAMAHVAAYSKHYHRAAKDVAAVVDRSGVEPILHDDITTHMCSAVGGSASGLICLFTGYILLEQRRAMIVTPHQQQEQQQQQQVTDMQVFHDMLLAFVLCYTLIFTVMEPLRASIKAVYVSFAQHPESLSQAYPLIYARLRRLSESNALS